MRIANIIKRFNYFSSRSRKREEALHQELIDLTGASSDTKSANEDNPVYISPQDIDTLNRTGEQVVMLRRENREMELLKFFYPTIQDEADIIKYDYATCVMDLKEVEDRFRTLDPEYYDYHFSRFMLGTTRGIIEHCDELHARRTIEFSHLEHFAHTSNILKASLKDRKNHLSKELTEKELVVSLLTISIKNARNRVGEGFVSISEKQSEKCDPQFFTAPVKASANAINDSGESCYPTHAHFLKVKNEKSAILRFEQERNTELRKVNWKAEIEKTKIYIALTENHIDEALAFQDALQKVEEHVFRVGNLRKALPYAMELIDHLGERAIHYASVELESIQSMKARQAAQFQFLFSEWELLGEPSRRLEVLERAIANMNEELMLLVAKTK